MRLHTDQASGASRGFAHAVFADEPSLERAIARNGELVRGRAIRVGYSDTKNAQPGKGKAKGGQRK